MGAQSLVHELCEGLNAAEPELPRHSPLSPRCSTASVGTRVLVRVVCITAFCFCTTDPNAPAPTCRQVCRAV